MSSEPKSSPPATTAGTDRTEPDDVKIGMTLVFAVCWGIALAIIILIRLLADESTSAADMALAFLPLIILTYIKVMLFQLSLDLAVNGLSFRQGSYARLAAWNLGHAAIVGAAMFASDILAQLTLFKFLDSSLGTEVLGLFSVTAQIIIVCIVIPLSSLCLLAVVLRAIVPREIEAEE